MDIDLKKQPLPKIYKRCGKDCYLDPIREKLIYITPEETVRQKVVSYLLNELKVPRDMITVEEHLSHYGIKSKRRADIVIHKLNEKDNTILPIAVVECKASGILLGEQAMNQVFDYANNMLCDYVMLTDGVTAFSYKYDKTNDYYIDIEKIPTYEEMLDGQYVGVEYGDLPERIPFEQLEEKLSWYQGCEIGENTPKSKAIPIMNLWEGLLDIRHKMPMGKYSIFNLVEDYGVRLLSYGNVGGGVFDGLYRSFLVEVNGNTEFVSIGISAYVSNAKPDVIKTSLNVAIDNEKVTHHSLQLVIDDNMIVVDDNCSFYHHGRIGISNLGSGRISELRSFVDDRYPQIIDGNKFYLGTLKHNKLWRLDDEDVISLIENLISYALIRDEYRESVKSNSKRK